MKITPGRIVMYRLNQQDAEKANKLCALSHAEGNTHTAGEEYPMIVVCVWENEFGQDIPGVNGQVFLDGQGTLWITSKGEGTEPGTWRWPTRE